jgi:prepilin-type N-terminal cleavage/methylation domain-containing protein
MRTIRKSRIATDLTRGFTLIELLIVIAIILILIAIALPNFLEAQIRARLTSTRACLNTYRTAQEAYFTDFYQYVPDVDGGEMVKGQFLSWDRWWAVNRGVRCDNVGELCTYAMMTTPIRYLTELCYDPFLEEQNDPIAVKPYSLPEYSTHLSGNAQREQWGKQYGVQYVILSRGPDLDRDPGNYDQLIFHIGTHTHLQANIPVVYSATNGTKSDGDLVVTNEGHLQ